ncbi:hypothetical protein [Alicyclobacillus macrosporangiidus]|uniref:hypothetical protein n=1 Tax=Alicyclobacillus macrosporangiidus TaxID=392015 RepID=UPI000558D29F|nr:hypothetical protein [Alicyclobacillus macrosporangiidus]
MELYVDGVLQNVADGTSLQDVLRSAVEDVERSGRLVRQLVVDGQDHVIADVLNGTVLLANANRIDLASCTIDEMVEDALASSAEMLPSWLRVMGASAEAFQVGDFAAGMKHFAESLDGLRWHLSLLEGLCTLHPGPSSVHDFSERLRTIASLLDEACQAQDTVSLADILSFEVRPWAEDWQAFLEMFFQQMKWERAKSRLRSDVT